MRGIYETVMRELPASRCHGVTAFIRSVVSVAANRVIGYGEIVSILLVTGNDY